jgi:Tfp pilus assembly protein FimT
MKREGLTIIETLIVIGILAILFAIAMGPGLRVLRGQQNKASLESVRQMFWQGATAAASRNQTLQLTRSGTTFTIAPVNGAAVRTFEVSSATTIGLPDGVVATFLPPGRVALASGVSNPFTVQTNGQTYSITVSLIGETQATTP